MATKTEFFHADVIKIFPGIKVPSLMHWVDKGLVETAFEPGSSAGKRTYAYANLLEIAFVDELASYGIPTTRIKSLLEDLPHFNPRSLFKSSEPSGVFVYGRGLGTPGRKEDLGENYEAVKMWSRAHFTTPAAYGQKVPEMAGCLSYIVVDVGAIKKEIDRRLEEEGWR